MLKFEHSIGQEVEMQGPQLDICAQMFAYAQPGTKYRQRRVQGLQGLEVKDERTESKEHKMWW